MTARITQRLAGLALAVLSAACQPAEQTTEQTPATKRESLGGQYANAVVRRLESDVTSFNPVVGGEASDVVVAKYLFTPLITLDRALKPSPGLALSWTTTEGGRRYQFVLDPRATFSDGTPVRGDDVVFTLQRIVAPSSEAMHLAGSFANLDEKQTRVLTDGRVEVVFREAFASQVARFADVFVLPQHVYARGSFRDDFNAHAVGSGPYTLGEQRPDGDIMLRRKPNYWGTAPGAETVVLKVIRDHRTAWAALKTGRIDETIVTSDTWQHDRENRAVTQTIAFRTFYPLTYNFIAWNGRHVFLRDPRVRRALGMCVPAAAMIDRVYHGTARQISGPFMPEEEAYNPAIAPLPYAPDDARLLLKSAGWSDHDGDGVLDRDGRPLAFEFLIYQDQTSQQFAQLMGAEWRRIGVVVTPVVMDQTAIVARVRAGNYDATYMAWGLDAEPDLYSKFHSAQMPPSGVNIVFYSNPEVDRLIEAARTEFERPKRMALQRRLHTILARDQPYTWTVQVATKWAVAHRLQGVEFADATGPFGWYPGELSWRVAPR